MVTVRSSFRAAMDRRSLAAFVAKQQRRHEGGQRTLLVPIGVAVMPAVVLRVAFGAGELRLGPRDVHLLPGFAAACGREQKGTGNG